MTQKQDILDQSVKGFIAVAGAALAKLTLNDLVVIATGCYVLVQMAYLLWKWYHEWVDRRRQSRARKGR